MKFLITISFIFLIFFCSTAQNKGDELRRDGKLEEAIKAYKENYINNPKDSKSIYNLACAIALTYSQKDSAFHYLNIALENDNSLWALADNDLLSLTTDERWIGVKKSQLQKYQDVNGKLEQPEYAVKLLSLIQKDQSHDYQLDMAKQYFVKHGKAPHWYYPIAAMKKEISARNFKEMELLILKFGWPKYSTVGKLAADAPLLIINHHEDEDVRIKYLDQIKNVCIENEGSCIEYAKIQDRILVNTGKPQIYGMQFRYNSERQLEPFPIKDAAYVDQRRKKIGLPPLHQYLKRKINYDFNVVQK